MKNFLKSLGILFIGFIVGGVTSRLYFKGIVLKPDAKSGRFRTYYDVLNQWMKLKNEGGSIESYLNKNSYKSIAIYGMGELGNRLCEELENTDISIKYIMDKNIDNIYTDYVALKIGEDLEEVDVVVVTVPFVYSGVKKEIKHYLKCPVISIEDLVFQYKF